jgi:predicted DNA-binding transcriptional regulator YafY
MDLIRILLLIDVSFMYPSLIFIKKIIILSKYSTGNKSKIVCPMPQIKKALIRYRTINNLLRGGSNISLDQMQTACMEAIGDYVSTRTIETDINRLRFDDDLAYYAPIKCLGEKFYKYTDPDYSIDIFPLKKEELSMINSIANMLKHFDNIPIFNELKGIAAKLSVAVVQYEIFKKKDIQNPDWSKVVDFEKGLFQPSPDLMSRLFDAIKSKQAIRLHYRKFNCAQEQEYIVSPYLLKEYRNRWYVVGYSQTRSGIRCFGLDRIVRMSYVTDIEFVGIPFSVQQYYRNVVGVSVVPGDPVYIRIAVTENQAAYLDSQPLHTSQQWEEKLPDNRHIYSFKLIPNYEFYAQILSFGESAEVISPADVRDEVKRKVESTVQRYHDQLVHPRVNEN